MKKFILVTLLVLTLSLSACSTDDDKTYDMDVLTQEESLGTLSYLASSFLNAEPQTVNDTSIAFLSNEEEVVIEEELDEVNQYMTTLQEFMDNGTNTFGSSEESDSERVGYSKKLDFTVKEEVFIIHYNIDETSGEISGIIVVGDVEYTITVLEDFAIDTETGEALLEEDDEDPDEEVDEEENDTKMVLNASNGEDSIKVTYKSETTEEGTTLKFHIVETISEVTRRVQMMIVNEEDSYKVTVEDEDGKYSFKRNEEDGLVLYKLQYKIGTVNGQVTIKEKTDEEGLVTYEYKIQENDKSKTIEKSKSKGKGKQTDKGNNQESSVNQSEL